MLLILTLALCIVLFSACSPSTDDASMEQKSRVSVDFSTFQVEVEDMSRSSRTALSTAATRLSFAVFNSNGTLVEGTTIHQEKTSGGEGFGSVEVELYPGDYKMVVVAHSGSDNADIESATSVILPGSTYTDTFTKVADFTVVSNQHSNLSKTLDRITSAFILKLNDTPPANASRIEVILNNGGSVPNPLSINPKAGLATENWSQTRSFTIEEITDETPDHIYYISKSLPFALTVKATAYDSGNEEIIRHIISDVPLTPNKKTVASGTFFQSSASGFFTITSDWDSDDQEIEY